MAQPDVHYDDGVLAINDRSPEPGLVLNGEIDESNYPALVRALDGVADATEVHLDLSGLAYCEVSCLRAMVRLALPANGHRNAPEVILHAVPPFLRATLRILGWDKLPGLSMTE